MSRERVAAAGIGIAVVLICVPVFVAWAFVVYDRGSGGPGSDVVKLLWVAAIGLPVVVAAGFGAWLFWPRSRAIAGGAGVLSLAALGVCAFTVSTEYRQPGLPGSFYQTPDVLGEPGDLLRSEPLPGGPEGADAFRILYTSTGLDGGATAASAILVVPWVESDEPRPIVAFTHGTIGVARNCAPSLRSNWPNYIDGLSGMVAAGYIIVAPDYRGMGSEGTHPYLVGEAAARDTLDAVRAARGFARAVASEQFVVWGSSQGGHSALFTGQFAASYAPELELVGIAASAPATDLAELFDRNLGTPFGNVLAAYAFSAWSRVYDVDLGTVVARSARPIVSHLAEYCFSAPKESLSVLPGAALLNLRFLSRDPLKTEPWVSLMRENTPSDLPLDVPSFVVQGDADPLVREDITRAFIDGLCEAGNIVEYRVYPGLGHVPAGPESAPDVLQWFAAMLRGDSPIDSCSNLRGD